MISSVMQSTTTRNTLALIGRLLMASLFLPAGLSKITGFGGTVSYISSVGLPAPTLAAAAAAGVETLGAVALIVGFQTRIAALFLAGFTLIANFFFHAYWSVPAEAQMMQQLLFNKNVAVVGGLLILAAIGAGQWSVDTRLNR